MKSHLPAKQITAVFPDDSTMHPATRALDGGLRPDPVTGAIAPGISMSVNNVFTPGAASFSAEGADLTDLPYLYDR